MYVIFTTGWQCCICHSAPFDRSVWLVHKVMRHPPACPELWRSLSVLLSRWGKPGRQTRSVSRRMVLVDIVVVYVLMYHAGITVSPPASLIFQRHGDPSRGVNEGQREQSAHQGESHCLGRALLGSLLESPFAVSGQCHAMHLHCGTDDNSMDTVMQPFYHITTSYIFPNLTVQLWLYCAVSLCLQWIMCPGYLAIPLA